MQVEWDVSPQPLLCTPCSCRTSIPMWGVHTDPSILVPSLLLSQGKRWGKHSCITLLSPPATHTAFPSPLMLESHRIPQRWRFFEPCPAALRWYTSQEMLQTPGGRIDPQCHDLTLHSATQQYGCIQDPIWERTHRATSRAGSTHTWQVQPYSGTRRHYKGFKLTQRRGLQITTRDTFASPQYYFSKLWDYKGCQEQ